MISQAIVSSDDETEIYILNLTHTHTKQKQKKKQKQKIKKQNKNTKTKKLDWYILKKNTSPITNLTTKYYKLIWQLIWLISLQ